MNVTTLVRIVTKSSGKLHGDGKAPVSRSLSSSSQTHDPNPVSMDQGSFQIKNIELIPWGKWGLKRNKIAIFKFMEEVLPIKKNSKRGRETLFRATYQNQCNLIQMADNKANIIISINTMIISSIIAITSYGAVAGKIDSYGADAIVPIVMIVLSCLVSVIFAIQAARPKLINPKVVNGSMQRSSLLFFGVIAGYSQQAYMAEMERLLNAGNELYEHMTIDLYNQGLVLKRKYNLLVYAYQVFMFGFILSVLIFLIFLAM